MTQRRALQTNAQGQVRVTAEVAAAKVVATESMDEELLVCSICRDGYKHQPKKVARARVARVTELPQLRCRCCAPTCTASACRQRSWSARPPAVRARSSTTPSRSSFSCTSTATRRLSSEWLLGGEVATIVAPPHAVNITARARNHCAVYSFAIGYYLRLGVSMP